MQNNIKFLFLIALILVIIAGVIVFFAFRGSPQNTGASGGVVGGGTLPGTNGVSSGNNTNGILTSPSPPVILTEDEKQKLIQLSKDPVVGPTINKTGDRVLYFKQGTGNLFETTLDGNGGETRLSNIIIKNIADSRWTPSKTYAAIDSIDSSAINNFWLHITGTSTIQTGSYGSAFLSSVFSPVEDKLAYLAKTGSRYTISISNPDGRSAKNIFSTEIPDFELSWPSKTTLALKTKSSAMAPSLFQILPVGGGSASVISSEEKSFDVLWAPDGVHYLASRSIPGSSDIKLEIKSLNVKDSVIGLTFKTLPEKCVFSKKEKLVLYCGIPRSLGREALPDAWWKKRTEFQDELWRVNLETGETKQLLNGGGFDMTHLFTSQNENYIFFVDKKDSTLWSFRLI